MLRIITGTAKNIRLAVPDSARPMMDRVKSSVFSMIESRISGANVLDLYAGSGALGIECLSRGARYCKFLEITEDGCSCINSNLVKCKVPRLDAKVVKLDSMTWPVRQIHANMRHEEEGKLDEIERYDIIFLCPPHPKVSSESLRLASRLLKEDGILIAECPFDRTLPDKCGSVYLELKKEYGKTHIYFYLTKEQEN